MAADAAVSAAYGSAGERCMAISQVVAVGHAADELVDAIKVRLPKIKVGDGLDPTSRWGPLVTREHRDKVASTSTARASRARRWSPTAARRRPRATASSSASRCSTTSRRRWTPTATRSSARCSASRASSTYDEAVRLVNENPYGNGTAIFTRDGGVARQFQFDVQAGMVGINVPIPVPVAYYSFGGWKASLFGDSHIYGPEGINFRLLGLRRPSGGARGALHAARRARARRRDRARRRRGSGSTRSARPGAVRASRSSASEDRATLLVDISRRQ